MINLVELCADAEEQQDSPCKWGNIVVGHACYCHNDSWKEGPRKCPIYRSFGREPDKWHRLEWETERVLVFKGFGKDADGNTVPITAEEDRPCMPDDDNGGCPMFEPAEQK